MDITSTERHDDLVVAGPYIRTSFDRAANDIGAFWERFISDGFIAKLGVNDTIYAVYTEYEGDFRGAYTMVLGTRVADNSPLAAGMKRVTIPHGRFARLPFAGDPKSVVSSAWGFVNGAWDRKNERRYSVDFETYSLSSFRDGYVEGEIWIGMR
jgi:predicted transcriptional regulator YdeE